MELPVAKIELPAEIPSCVGVKGGGEGMMRTYCIIHQAERNYRRGNGRGRREGAQRGIDGYFNAAEGSSFFIRATSRN